MKKTLVQRARASMSCTLGRTLARVFFGCQRWLQCTIIAPRTPTGTTEQRAFIDSYSDVFYWIMAADAVRMAAYRAAVSEGRVRGRTLVDIGTGARMPLALMALSAGAAHVEAIEANPVAYGCAQAHRETLAAQTRGRLRLHEGLSTRVSLQQRADGVIHELIGTVASSEGFVHSVSDAQERLLTRDALVIPVRVGTLLVPVEHPLLSRRSQLLSWCSTGASRLDPSPGVQHVYNTPRTARLSSRPVVVEEFNCGVGAPSLRAQMSQQARRDVVVERDGWLAGCLLSCFFVTSDGIAVVSGLDQITSWGQVFARMVERPVRVRRGDKLAVAFDVDASDITPRYRLEVTTPDSSRYEISWSGPAALVSG